ncbi:MAG: cupin domain-containing protein [Actinomycetota bacterium]|nr:cupin domain-containing protein [Actinomycetota bacterium]
MPFLAHWDDVRSRRRESGHLGGTWFDLGRAAGSVAVGVQRIQIDAGKWSTPAHVEGADEEIFFVLGGSGISWQLTVEGPAAYSVAEGDCLAHLPGREAHTLRAGPEGLDVLAFGGRAAHGNTVLPRARVAWMWPAFVEVVPIEDEAHPYVREVAAGEPDVGEPLERPRTIVNLGDAEVAAFGRGETVESVRRDLGRAAGSRATGLKHFVVAPGKLNAPPHCHSAEEEIFVVLDGEGTIELDEEVHAVRRGCVVARPAGTRVAHAFRAGDEGLSLLAYGTREPNDITYYPRSNKIYWRGVGVIGRIESLDYWDGES